MAVIDSYSETNQSASQNLLVTGTVGIGQSFTGDGSVLTSAQLYLKETNTPTGNAVAKIYAHSGTFGTSSVPTGAALATSDNFDVTGLTTAYVLKTLTFSGANQITLASGTKYVVTLEYSGGGGTQLISVGYDSTSPTHAGNKSTYNGTSWSAQSTNDMCFYVNGNPVSTNKNNFFRFF